MPTIQGDGDTEKETNVGIQTSRKLVDNMLCKQYPIVFVFNPREAPQMLTILPPQPAPLIQSTQQHRIGVSTSHYMTVTLLLYG